jgi:hypothetical protein
MGSLYRTCCRSPVSPEEADDSLGPDEAPGTAVELRADPRRGATRFRTAMMQASGQFVPRSARWRSICVLRSARRNALSEDTCPSVAANTMMNVDIQTAHLNEGHTNGVTSYPCWPGEPSNAPNVFKALCKVLMIDLEAEMPL